MKKFWVAVLAFALKLVDLSLSIDGSVFTFVLEIGGLKVIDFSLDLLNVQAGRVITGRQSTLIEGYDVQKVSAAFRNTDSKFKSTRVIK